LARTNIGALPTRKRGHFDQSPFDRHGRFVLSNRHVKDGSLDDGSEKWRLDSRVRPASLFNLKVNRADLL
jgi:hypothetical protein